jgi:DNA-binding response OmpR family regulator
MSPSRCVPFRNRAGELFSELHEIFANAPQVFRKNSLVSLSDNGVSAAVASKHIVVVEDQRDMAEAIALRLRSEGFTVSLAFDGPSGVTLCESAKPDAVVLDINLPGFDGLEVCRQIQRERRVPVVMLTARDSETDLLVGLAVGADDYITKPFSPRELVARIHALLRRSAVAVSAIDNNPGNGPSSGALTGTTEGSADGSGNAQANGRFESLGVVLDTVQHTATHLGNDVHLTVTEFELAHWFLAHPRMVFTREQLLRSVWGYPDGSGERTVDSHIQAVRKKLGPEFVRTVHGVGYALGVQTTPPPPSTSAPSATP